MRRHTAYGDGEWVCRWYDALHRGARPPATDTDLQQRSGTELGRPQKGDAQRARSPPQRRLVSRDALTRCGNGRRNTTQNSIDDASAGVIIDAPAVESSVEDLPSALR